MKLAGLMATTLSVILFSTSVVFAMPGASQFGDFLPVCTNNSTASNTTVCKDVAKQASGNTNIFITIIRDVINIISFIVGVSAIFIIIISGMKMITSGGDSKSVSEAKGGVLGAVIGILVVVLAQSFVIFVLDRIK